MKESTISRINRQLESSQGAGFRKHLGASVIGRKCPREIWYIFRWAKRSSLTGRIIRLFSRGDREEPALVSHLRKSGVHVLDKDPETGKQFRIEDHQGHFGGSLDAKLFDTIEYPMQWVLGEFKTHNDKSFKELRSQGVEKSKYEHFVQAQIYMRYEKLPAALYFAVNKNDDDIEVQEIRFDAGVAERFVVRAHHIIYAEAPPERTPNASPGWYICQFCNYRSVCHDKQPKEKNCRTCIYSVPSEGFKWLCRRFNYPLSEEEQRIGCLEHSMIPED